MKPVIIVGGETDKQIIERLLPDDLRETVTFHIGKGRSNAESLARSILITKQRPVVLIYDADTTDANAIHEQREFSTWYFNRATEDIPFHTIIAVPEIEVIFFHNQALLERLLNHQFSEMEWTLAQSQPKKVIKSMAADNYSAFIVQLLRKMDEQDIEMLRSHPIMEELNGFLKGIPA